MSGRSIARRRLAPVRPRARIPLQPPRVAVVVNRRPDPLAAALALAIRRAHERKIREAEERRAKLVVVDSKREGHAA